MKDTEITEAQRTIAELTRTPIGRRWLLKMGVSTAAALAVPAWAAAQAPPAPAPAAPRARRGIVFHFALGPAVAALPDLRLVVNGHRIPLTAHSRSSRSALRSQGTLWSKLRLSELTHFASVPLPRDRVQHMTVYGTHDGQTVLVAQKFYAPPTVTAALASAAFLLEGSYRSVTGSSERLSALGLDASQITSVREVVDLDTTIDHYQSAIALSMHHPNVGTKDPTANAATQQVLGGLDAVKALGTTIKNMPGGYGTNVAGLNRDGTPSTITIKGTTSGFSITQLSKDQKFTDAARPAFQASLRQVRDTGSLGTVLDKPLDQSPPDSRTWHQPEGFVVHPTPHAPSTGLGAGVDVQVTNPGMVHGTQIQVTGAFSGGQLPVKLFNNYVRWVWVYVQYLKADGTNLSLTPSATFPETKHAKSVGLLPQVFTVLGVPLWDTNTLDATLTFPPEASSARLLFCGLGSDAVDGGWRQYFPDDAYDANHIAPTDEVLFPAIMTGIVTLGLTTFVMVMDIDAAATFAIAKKGTTEAPDIAEDVLTLIDSDPAISGGESIAAKTIVGIDGHFQQNLIGADANNIWNTVAAIGGVIPKILFGQLLQAPMWLEMAGAVAAQEAAQDILDSIPILGVVLGVIEVLGDLATLVEAIAETATSPWVIANQINLTYTATVTVSHDDRVTTWPHTAASWEISPKIDGATALPSTTGTIDPVALGGNPLVIPNLTVPFGGLTITWAFTMRDREKNQVGTATMQLPNDDSANPPTSVAFAITELPEPITARTVFTRTDTTTFSSTVGVSGGYIWSTTLPPNQGTVTTPGAIEVTGVAIATRLGVAGIVWKAGDNKYYLRGIPVAETGNTIHLGSATHQGFGARPFLLFDSLVGPNDLANHVLLEPDATSGGYHVRRLTINNPNPGDLSWEPNTSYGFFPLPVNAAALHSSGWVVAIHTDTGRVGRVLPANTSLLPPLARYTAGFGSEIGLLNSPTAVAVTNPGVVIVLEAGASQLAAFDLNGNPARYFGTSSPAAFTLPLPQPATYLDVAVDGSAQIYVLSFGRDGSRPADYQIDVYTPNGTPLVTSTGTNVPHIAVDYWRSIFAANYTALLDDSGQPHIDPSLGVAEPSLSVLDPITP